MTERLIRIFIASILILAVVVIMVLLSSFVPRPEQVEFVLIQLNDLEDIRPAVKDQPGNLARVAALRRRLRLENPDTYMVLPGDLFNPSPLSNIIFGAGTADGRQMIEATNQAGLDFATLGNHASDLTPRALKERLDESNARWVSTNVVDNKEDSEKEKPKPYAGVHTSRIFEVRNAQGARARVALIGLTAGRTEGPGDYKVRDSKKAAREEIDRLEGSYDILIALTHLSVPQARDLVNDVPGIHLVLAGGDSSAYPTKDSPQDKTPIYVAEPDARSVWVHSIGFQTTPEGGKSSRKRTLSIHSRLMRMDQTAEDDPQTTEVLRTWDARFLRGFPFDPRDKEKDPDIAVAEIPQCLALDGRSEQVRNRPTTLTRLVAIAMLRALREGTERQLPGHEWPRDVPSLPHLAIFNGGLLRIDRVIDPGPLTAYQVHRMIPYRDDPVIRVVRMRGLLVQYLLERGAANAGKGAFLQAYDQDGRSLREAPASLKPEREYLVAINDYLIDGKEEAFFFLGRLRSVLEAAGLMQMLDEPKGIGTIRQAIIESVKDGDMSKIPPWKPAQDNVANSAQEKDFHLETLTAPSVPALFATRPDGPFIREPAPISRTPIPPTKPEFSSALEDKLVLEEDPYTRLDLARTLIVVQPTNRTAAQVLVGGAISSNADLRDKSRRFLAEVLPSAPDSLVEELLKTMQQADEFTRADLADWLALIDPEGRMHSRPEKERH